jgi:hypothetical protein
MNLTDTKSLWYELTEIYSCSGGLEPQGNPVRVGDGHAAVIGDETCQIHCPDS